MKLSLSIALFFVSIVLFAQDTTGLKQATIALNKALLAKDTVVLKQLIADEITYGHSNGWLQSKKDIINDFASGKIEYKNIVANTESYTCTKEAIAIRCITNVEGVVNGNAFKMDLQVLQVWKRLKKQWVLIARQSVKLS